MYNENHIEAWEDTLQCLFRGRRYILTLSSFKITATVGVLERYFINHVQWETLKYT